MGPRGGGGPREAPAYRAPRPRAHTDATAFSTKPRAGKARASPSRGLGPAMVQVAELEGMEGGRRPPSMNELRSHGVGGVRGDAR